MIDVYGELASDGLKRLNHGLSWQGVALPPIKVSWQSETRLRFALKNPWPGLIADMCRQVGLQVSGIRRTRIGRLPMRSEERRVGKEWGSTFRSRWSAYY